jgi:hypothetical protein
MKLRNIFIPQNIFSIKKDHPCCRMAMLLPERSEVAQTELVFHFLFILAPLKY